MSERLEVAMQREADDMAAQVDVRCIPDATAKARKRYGRLLAKLEKRLERLR
jgi:hypothetical protein